MLSVLSSSKLSNCPIRNESTVRALDRNHWLRGEGEAVFNWINCIRIGVSQSLCVYYNYEYLLGRLSICPPIFILFIAQNGRVVDSAVECLGANWKP